MAVPYLPPYILLVDDDAVMVALLSFALEKSGFRVNYAESAVDALRELYESAAQQVYYSSVVTDFNMPPGMDGAELIKHIKTESSFAGLRVVMYTSEDRGLQQVARNAGAEMVFTKPDWEPLLAWLRATFQPQQPPLG